MRNLNSFQKTLFLVFLPGIIFFSIQFFSCKKKGKKNPEACNGDIRREVKTLTDAAVANLDTSAVFATIAYLGGLDVGTVDKKSPRSIIEMKTYTVKCKVDKLSREWDGDLHLRLKDGENYLIAEAANPGCDFIAASPYLQKIQFVRDWLSVNDVEGKEVYVTGVAFVDIDHGFKRKEAKNKIELHPILDIHF